MIAGLVGAASARDCRQPKELEEKPIACPRGMLDGRLVVA